MADVFMLEANTVLNRATIAQILENGHSRIPIYEYERNNIIGLLLVKDLIMQNPDNPMTIKVLNSVLPLVLFSPSLDFYLSSVCLVWPGGLC